MADIRQFGGALEGRSFIVINPGRNEQFECTGCGAVMKASRDDFIAHKCRQAKKAKSTEEPKEE